LNTTGIGLTVDHIIPLSKWQEYKVKYNPNYEGNDIENIQPLCWNCNIKKSNKTNF
jgi:5-methylcytosine-specific restriction endonuclease McrA